MEFFFIQIINWLLNNDRKVISFLEEGMQEKKIKSLLDSEELACPNEILELYKICGGTTIKEGMVLDYMHFFPGFYLLQFEMALRLHKNFKDDARWNKNWLPIFANGGGDFFVVDCSKKFAESKVIGFMLGYTDHEVEYLSVVKMLETIATCYKKGAYYLTEDLHLEINGKEEAFIANNINPNLSRWNDVLSES